MSQLPKIILVHGNGGATAEGCWFPWVAHMLREMGFEVISPTMPDNVEAKAAIWLLYLREVCGADEQTIIVGHSSGAVAALRLAETTRILGSILVAPCYTDLGMESEALSGYYDHPWNWQAIKQNQHFIVQLASQDDPFIPVREARFIHEQLDSEYHEFTDREHFGWPTDIKELPEVIEIVRRYTTR
jgi:hypothetical protein